MDNLAIIESARDGTTLEFSDRSGDYYRVRLNGSDFHGVCQVYAYDAGAGPDKFFRDLAANWQGWRGEKEWSSLEDELEFSATCDSTGHTSLLVVLRSRSYPFAWSLSAILLLEAGGLEGIAAKIERFFGDNS